ncbi:tRNA methyltransferase 10 [Tyrophagus putrescentiae]|nr:tRNA methyltransferase 10 [Tyrophagus putrescentiae]
MEKWNATKADRRKREKAKRKAKRAQLREAGVPVPQLKLRKDQLVRQADSPCKVALVIDCDFAEYMTEMELKKLCKQINRCYAVNKRSTKPVQLFFTSVTGEVRKMMDRYQTGYKSWDAVVTDRHWKEVFNFQAKAADGTEEPQEESKVESTENPSKKRIVYLTGDSPNSLEDCAALQAANEGVFIIGGLIDHNRHKGLTLERATAVASGGLEHARLPIGEYISMKQHLILAIPHVFEIMLYAANGTLGDGVGWAEIFHRVIPQRKQAGPGVGGDNEGDKKEEEAKVEED